MISYLMMRKALQESECIVECDCGAFVSRDELIGEWQDAYDPQRCPTCCADKEAQVREMYAFTQPC